MSKQPISRVKLNPQLGRMPTLQFCRPEELRIDASYQRDVQSGPSQALIRRLAQHWNWDLCQPLVVARRSDLTERLFVIDGQHRLAAARLRGDIPQLPCVIVSYANAADEAASFVHLNQQRKPLSAIDLFRAAVASTDPVAAAIMAAMADAGLSLAPHSNYTAWKPGMISNVGGIQRSWRVHGENATRAGLRALAEAFGGQVLRYAGTLLPGLVAVCADEMDGSDRFDEKRFERFQTMLAIRSQSEWCGDVARERADNPGLRFDATSTVVIRRAWAKASGDQVTRTATVVPAKRAPALAPLPSPDGKAWCDQCDMRVTPGQVAGCKSRFCSVREVRS